MVGCRFVLTAAALGLFTSLAAAQDPPASEPAQPAAETAALTPERRGDIYMARKMYREAIETYQGAIKEVEKSREAQKAQLGVLWNKLGIAYHQLMQLDTAKRHYERALRFNPKYAEAMNNIGTVHYAKRSYRRAVNQYKKALKLAPNSASIYSNLGTAYFARKKYEDAAKAYQQALALDPEVFEHRSTYGVMLQERNVEERAKFHYYLAKVYAQAGVNDRALQYIRRSLEEGFKDKRKYLEEPEFAALRELPEFQELMALEPRVL
ncbi:MAG: tetratricopeptide repeat protein [Acidobacteria bacterium]|nr:tetratricopeptide repeat protein [Acidobacteriota bacterium]